MGPKRRSQGGLTCAVAGCKNNQQKTRGTGMHYYRFPSRPWLKERRDIWIRFTNRVGKNGEPWKPTVNHIICNEHFEGGFRSNDPRKINYNPTILVPRKKTLRDFSRGKGEQKTTETINKVRVDCLLCSRMQECTPDKYDRKLPTFPGAEGNELLNEQLWTTFVLRHLLQVSAEKCGFLLQNTVGIMKLSRWFLFCGTCFDRVKEAFQIYLQVTKLSLEMKQIQDTIHEKMMKNDVIYWNKQPEKERLKRRTVMRVRNLLKFNMTGRTDLQTQTSVICGTATPASSSRIIKPVPPTSSLTKPPVSSVTQINPPAGRKVAVKIRKVMLNTNVKVSSEADLRKAISDLKLPVGTKVVAVAMDKSGKIVKKFGADGLKQSSGIGGVNNSGGQVVGNTLEETKIKEEPPDSPTGDDEVLTSTTTAVEKPGVLPLQNIPITDATDSSAHDTTATQPLSVLNKSSKHHVTTSTKVTEKASSPSASARLKETTDPPSPVSDENFDISASPGPPPGDDDDDIMELPVPEPVPPPVTVIDDDIVEIPVSPTSKKQTLPVIQNKTSAAKALSSLPEKGQVLLKVIDKNGDVKYLPSTSLGTKVRLKVTKKTSKSLTKTPPIKGQVPLLKLVTKTDEGYQVLGSTFITSKMILGDSKSSKDKEIPKSSCRSNPNKTTLRRVNTSTEKGKIEQRATSAIRRKYNRMVLERTHNLQRGPSKKDKQVSGPFTTSSTSTSKMQGLTSSGITISPKQVPKSSKCPDCDFMIPPNSTAKKNHMNMHVVCANMEIESDDKIKCKLCDSVFTNKRKCYNHVRQNHGASLGLPSFFCDTCGAIFTQISTLTIHQKAKHENQSKYRYFCEDCGLDFAHFNRFEDHRLTKHDGGKIVCDICGCSFGERFSLVRHMKKAHPEEHNLSRSITSFQTAFDIVCPPTNSSTVHQVKSTSV